MISSSFCLPHRFSSARLDERLLLLRLLAVQPLDESPAQPLGEPQLEDDVVPRLLHDAVRRAEQFPVAAAAVLGIGAEAARAVVLRHHAPLLDGAPGAASDVLPQFEGARIDVDVAILGEHRLSLHLEIVDENLFHCLELFAREVFEKGPYISRS